MRIVAKNLPTSAEEAEIRGFFARNSKVTDVYMLRDGRGRFRRVCFVGYATEEEAQEAARYFNNCMFKNHKITVEMARGDADAAVPRDESQERRVSYSRTVFVRGLSGDTDPDALGAELGRIGKLLELRTERKDGRMCAVVKFCEGRHAVKALRSLRTVLGMRVRVGTYNEAAADRRRAYYNSLFFSFDTVVQRTCELEGVDKRDLVNIRDASLGARVALIETNLVEQTRVFLEQNGIFLDAVGDERSKTRLILRNADLFGALDLVAGDYTVSLAPSRCLALLDFRCEQEALAACRALNMRRHKNQIIYCEFAPLSSGPGAGVPGETGGAPAASKTNKIVVKNVPFQASAKDLRTIFASYAHVVDVRLPLKGDRTHRGFGFIILDSVESAEKTIAYFGTSTHLYGRRLVLEKARL